MKPWNWLVLLSAALLIGPASARADQILILVQSGHSAELAVRDLGAWIEGARPGTTVSFSADLTPDVLDSPSVLSPAQMALLNSFDLVILPRFGAGAAANYASRDWNQVSAPILNMNPFTYLETGRWGWAPDSPTPTSPSIRELVVADSESPFFAGIDTTAGRVAVYRTANATMQLHRSTSVFTGRVIGWTDVEVDGTHQQFPWILAWDGGEGSYYSGGEQAPGGARTLFLGPLSNSPHDLTYDGQRLLLNAITLTIDPAAEPVLPTYVKQRRTFYTEERLAEIRDSLASSVSSADGYLSNYTPTALWRFVPGQSLPRSFAIHSRASSETYPTPEPWKVQVTVEGQSRRMPSNDFRAYYESGLDPYGWFDPALADRSLLVNTLYPDKPADWGVDDGWGWVDASGRHWTFIAHYLHWHRFIRVRWMIESFRNAYLYTGDPRYGRAGLILLDRLADTYPALDTSAFNSNVFLNSDGGTHTGKMVGRFWEANHIREIMAGYDAFFPLIEAGDPVVVSFLNQKAREYKLGSRKETINGIALNIEDNIIRQILPAVRIAQIRGDYGNPSALAMAAVVLDEPDGYTGQVLEFMLQSGGLERIGGQWRTTGGDILPGLVNRTDRDGQPETGSPEYNRIYIGRMGRTADILEGYGAPPGLNLAEHPKYLKMTTAMRPLSMLDRYVPPVGDSHRTGRPDPTAVSPSPEESQHLAGFGFAALRDGRRNPQAWPDRRRAAWLYYGRNAMRDAGNNVIAGGHAHRNALSIGLYGFGLDLMPDLGYPEQTGSWPKRINWTANTISHNTVLVDAQRQDGHWVGTPRHFEEAALVRFIDVEAPVVYPQTDLYRRTTAMITVDDDNSYLVDLFRIKGGNDHLFSFHGAEGPVETEGLALVSQNAGTYAGVDVPFPGEGENTTYNTQVGNGFNYLYDVRRAASPGGGFSVEWQVVDTWSTLPSNQRSGIRLRLTMLNDDLNELAIAHGDPPQHAGNPRRLNYVLARRQGSNLQTAFTSVIEPYRHSRLIESVEPLEIRRAADGSTVPHTEARGLRVVLANGTVDLLIHSVDTETEYEIDGLLRFQGTLGFFREDRSGTPLYSYLHGGSILRRAGDRQAAIHTEQGTLACVVLDYTREMSTQNYLLIGVANAEQYVDLLPGRWIYVETDGWRNGAYLIRGAALFSGDRIRLDLGDTTLVREYVDSFDFSKGFIYNIAPGAAATIPLSAEIVSPAPESFEAWMENWPEEERPPEGARGPADTPAGDGVSNLVKYALDIPPLKPARESLPRLVRTEDRLGLEFERSVYAGVEFALETSVDLTDWEPTPASLFLLDSPDEAGRQRVRLLGDLPAAGSSRHFIRLRIEQEPAPSSLAR